MAPKGRYNVMLPEKETEIVKENCVKLGISFSGLLSQFVIGMALEIEGKKHIYDKSIREMTIGEIEELMGSFLSKTDNDQGKS